jgi:uncharacterized membrane-anchored protein
MKQLYFCLKNIFPAKHFVYGFQISVISISALIPVINLVHELWNQPRIINHTSEGRKKRKKKKQATSWGLCLMHRN